MSLNDKIAQANSLDEIETLLKEGESYKQAHPTTAKRWQRTAKRRRAVVQSPDFVAPVEEQEVATDASGESN